MFVFVSSSDKIQSIAYAHHSKQLISCSADGGIVVWNMDVERQEVGFIYFAFGGLWDSCINGALDEYNEHLPSYPPSISREWWPSWFPTAG